MDAHENGGGSIHRRDLLQRHEIRQGVEAEPVVLLRHQHPEKPDVRELLNQRRLEVGVPVPCVDERRKLALGELASGGLNRALFFGQRS